MTTQTLDSEASQALLRYTKQGIPFPAYLRDKLTPEQLAALSEQERRATVSVIDDNGRKQSDVIDEAVIEFAPTEVPRLDIGIHDFIDALAAEVTLGTILPFNFARETFKMMLLANCRPALSWFHTLHPRQYVILVSDSPGMGKGETFRRCSQTLIKDSYPIQFLDGDGIGSPEYACLALGGQWSKQKKVDGIEVHISTEPRIVHYDEGRKLFQKDTTGSSGQSDRGLVTLFTKLFESNAHSTGSFRNGRASIDKADGSLLLHFTRAGFDRSFAGSGATRDGFLSRCCLVADKSNPVKGDWP